MKSKLIKDYNNYYLKHNDKLIGTTDSHLLSSMNVIELSLKNCQTIERNYDLDEEISKIVKTIVPDDRGTDIWYGTSMAVGKQCFQKALEILGDKKYSEGDMEEAFADGQLNQLHNQKYFSGSKAYIQSLQQTEWDVEIVMETCSMNPSDLDCSEIVERPKLGVDGCIILKRK